MNLSMTVSVSLSSCRENLPGHFKFKEYCPQVFRNLRERFGIEDLDYQACGVLKYCLIYRHSCIYSGQWKMWHQKHKGYIFNYIYTCPVLLVSRSPGFIDPQPPAEECRWPRRGSPPQLLWPHAGHQANLQRGCCWHAQHPVWVSPGKIRMVKGKVWRYLIFHKKKVLFCLSVVCDFSTLFVMRFL